MHNRMEASRIIVARERRVELGAGGNHVGHFEYLGVDPRYSLFRSAERVLVIVKLYCHQWHIWFLGGRGGGGGGEGR